MKWRRKGNRPRSAPPFREKGMAMCRLLSSHPLAQGPSGATMVRDWQLVLLTYPFSLLVGALLALLPCA
jgi:hypothetical protein